MRKTEVIAYFKTQAGVRRALLARGYQITQPAISKWGEVIPEIPARILHQASGGALEFDESAYRADPTAIAT